MRTDGIGDAFLSSDCNMVQPMLVCIPTPKIRGSANVIASPRRREALSCRSAKRVVSGPGLELRRGFWPCYNPSIVGAIRSTREKDDVVETSATAVHKIRAVRPGPLAAELDGPMIAPNTAFRHEGRA